MSDLDDTRRELAAERPRRYFDLECRRLTNMRGDEFVKRYHKDGFITSGIPLETLSVLIDLMIWLKLRGKDHA